MTYYHVRFSIELKDGRTIVIGEQHLYSDTLAEINEFIVKWENCVVDDLESFLAAGHSTRFEYLKEWEVTEEIRNGLRVYTGVRSDYSSDPGWVKVKHLQSIGEYDKANCLIYGIRYNHPAWERENIPGTPGMIFQKDRTKTKMFFEELYERNQTSHCDAKRPEHAEGQDGRSRIARIGAGV